MLTARVVSYPGHPMFSTLLLRMPMIGPLVRYMVVSIVTRSFHLIPYSNVPPFHHSIPPFHVPLNLDSSSVHPPFACIYYAVLLFPTTCCMYMNYTYRGVLGLKCTLSYSGTPLSGSNKCLCKSIEIAIIISWEDFT